MISYSFRKNMYIQDQAFPSILCVTYIFVCMHVPYGLIRSRQLAWRRKMRFWNEAQWRDEVTLAVITMPMILCFIIYHHWLLQINKTYQLERSTIIQYTICYVTRPSSASETVITLNGYISNSRSKSYYKWYCLQYFDFWPQCGFCMKH